MQLTLVQLAGQAGLSHPFLSQLERGLVRPSMSSLHRIAQALGTSQPALMSQTLDPGDTRVGLVPAGEGIPVQNPGGSARSLVSGTRALYPILFEGALQEFGPAYAHDGDELIHVLSGTIEVEIVGEGLHTVEVHVLDPGVGLVAPGNHVLVANRIHAPFLFGFPGNGVETDGGEHGTVIGPEMLVVDFDDPRPLLPVLGRQTVLPHLRVFDQMVVDRDDLVVILEWHRASCS